MPHPQPLRMLFVAAIVGSSQVLAIGETTSEGKPLVSFATPGAFSTKGLAATSEGDSLVLTDNDATVDAGRLIIPSGATPWDLRGRTLVTKVRNLGTKPTTVRLRIENDDAKGLANANEMPVPLMPGATREIRLPVVARPEDPTYAPFKEFMMYYKRIDVRDNTIDAANVTRAVIEIEGGGESQRVEVAPIRVEGEADTAQPKFFPFVDKYGQYTHSEWYGKVHDDADLAAAKADEVQERNGRPGPTDWDKYGGWSKGPTLDTTGHFHTAKHDGKWWLVDPDGKLFWSYGPTGVGFGGDVSPVTDRETWYGSLPAKDDPTYGRFYSGGHSATYMHYVDRDWTGYDVGRANLLRKYGKDYESLVSDVSHERLRSWGFNTIGNWSSDRIYLQHRTPYTVAIHYPATLIHSHMPDVYAPDWEPNVRARMLQEKGKTADDAWNIGYFVDNERWWGWRPRAAAVGEETLKNPPERMAKITFVNQLKAKYGDIAKLNAAWGTSHESWDALLAFRQAPDMKNEKVLADCGDFGMAFAERYFTVVKDAVKKVAPNTMYLGCRFHGHVDPELVKLTAKYVDVVSYNIYDNPPDGRVNQYRDIDAPLMITEWGVGSDPAQTPFRGEKPTEDPRQRSHDIAQYMDHALKLPNCVGAHFFQYRDQPITGRPDGEATLRGFVNVVDTPNFELVETNRRIGETLYQKRSGAK